MGTLSDFLMGRRVYLDANIFIYALEGLEPWPTILRDVFSSIDAGMFSAVTSELSLAECLVRPFSLGREDIAGQYRCALQPRPTLTVAPICTDILVSAARLRGSTGLKLPDAIHAATAHASTCSAFLTNDTGFCRLQSIDVVLLSKWVAR